MPFVALKVKAKYSYLVHLNRATSMTGAQAGTSAASASKIMGSACITIEEVLGLFPEAKNWVNPADYQQIPFSAQTLYYLSEHKFRYVLFPAIPCHLKNSYIHLPTMENFFRTRFPEIGVNSKAFYRIAAYALNNNFCPAKWYLMAGQVLNLRTIVAQQKVGNIPWKIERSLIYVYAWTLFWQLREKSIFNGKLFACNDYFSSKRNSEVVLRFGDLEIFISQLGNEIKPRVGKVPSIIYFDENKKPPA